MYRTYFVCIELPTAFSKNNRALRAFELFVPYAEIPASHK